MRPCGCGDRGKHRGNCPTVIGVAGERPPAAWAVELCQRKPRAKRVPSPPVEVRDLGPLADEAEELRTRVAELEANLAAAKDDHIATLRAIRPESERLQGEREEAIRQRDAARARIAELERAQIGGGRQVERLEADLAASQTWAIELERQLGVAHFRSASAVRFRHVRAVRRVVWGGAPMRDLRGRLRTALLMVDRLRVQKGERPHRRIGSKADLQAGAAALPSVGNPYTSSQRPTS